MTIREFAQLLHVSEAAVYKMIKRQELPLKGKKLDLLELSRIKRFDLSAFLNGQYWSKQAIKRTSGIDKFYSFNKYWKMQGNKPAFKIGKVEYFLIKEEE